MCSMCGFLHKINCVTAYDLSSYTIYNILCNYPHSAHRNISRAGLPLVGSAENLKTSLGARCPQGGLSVPPWDSLAYTVPSSWYMLGGPKMGPRKWWSEERNRPVLFDYYL